MYCISLYAHFLSHTQLHSYSVRQDPGGHNPHSM